MRRRVLLARLASLLARLILLFPGKKERILVVSDTHSALDTRLFRRLPPGIGLVVHCGDISSPEVIADLARVAPVRAVRGNVESRETAEMFPDEEVLEFAGRRILVRHDFDARWISSPAVKFEIALFGHTHLPGWKRRNGRLFLNPGSAGPRRYRGLPASAAILHFWRGLVLPEILFF